MTYDRARFGQSLMGNTYVMAVTDSAFGRRPCAPATRFRIAGSLRKPGASRAVRLLAGLAVAAVGFGFGLVPTITAGDSTVTALPIPPPCLLNNDCGIGNADEAEDLRELRAACAELQSRGESSPECDALNR